jgi:hypothetical protein
MRCFNRFKQRTPSDPPWVQGASIRPRVDQLSEPEPIRKVRLLPARVDGERCVAKRWLVAFRRVVLVSCGGSEPVAVPDLVGLPLDEARELADGALLSADR